MKIGNFIGTVLAICVVGVVHNTQGQSVDSAQTLSRMHTFPEGLIWVGQRPPTEPENAELLEIVRNLQAPDWPAKVEQFLNEHPHSAWAASLHYDYASYCRRSGRTTKALEQYETAWALAKDDASQKGQYVGGAVLAHWMDLLSSLGRLEKLQELIGVGDQWHFVNHHDFVMYQGAKNSFYLMQAHPAIAYRCGTFALKAVGGVLQPGNRDLQSLADIASPTNGFTMAGLMELSKQYGLDMMAVRRTKGQDLAGPSVVHWRQNHYAAILARRDDGSYLVSDPTFGDEKWIAGEVINEEASGEFLVPRQSKPTGWTQLAKNEMARIHGMGMKNNMPDPKDRGAPPTCTGMPVAWVTEPFINLWISDEPISYLTSRGEPFPFRLTFKQRDSRPDVQTPYIQNTGWNQSWLSSIHLIASTNCSGGLCLPSLSASSAQVYLADGGEVDFAQGQTYDQETRLLLLPEMAYQGSDNGLRLVHSDGAQDIYGLAIPNTGTGGSAEGDYVRTQHIDPDGNSTWFNWTNAYGSYVLANVVDPDGRTNFLSYTIVSQIVTGAQLYLLTGVTGPYGLSASFAYDANDNLTNITDAAGMSSSVTYDTSNNPTALITPYGTNTFALADYGISYGGNDIYGTAGGDNNGLIDRSALVTDPTGANNLYVYRYDSENVLTSPTFTGMPSGTPLGTLDNGGSSSSNSPAYLRNSFHWGPRQYGDLHTLSISNFNASDYLLARTQHWLQDTNYQYLTDLISVERDPSPDGGNTEGLKTFYDYQGKAANYIEGTNALPAVIAWVLPNGDTHYEYFQYDYFGNVTNDITTYTSSSGSVGTRTNQFIYAGNTYSNILFNNDFGSFAPVATNSFTVPDLLTKVIAADGSPVWSYSGFDLITRTNLTWDQSGDTNIITQTSLRVIADYATNGVDQVATTAFVPPSLLITQYDLFSGLPIGATFNGYNKIASSTSVAGLTTTNIYNASGFLARTIDLQTTRTNSFGYGNNGLIAAFTNELGLSVSATWDNLLRLTSVQYPDGTYISNLYNQLDLGSQRDRLGHWTAFAYDGAEHLTAITNANTAVTQYIWCGCGDVTEVVDPLNNPTYLNYDTQGNLTNLAFPDGSAQNYSYDSAERRITAADGAGRVWQLGYNNQGLVTTVSNIYGQAEGITYDIRDRQSSIMDANNITVTNTFDPLDRILTRIWPDGIGEGYGYSPQGLAFYTNRDFKVTGYARDAATRIVEMTNANLEVTQYAYDPAGDIVSVIDGLNHTNSWQYNQFGWLTNEVDGLGRNAFQYAYNANGWVTNRATLEKGNTGYSYDNVGNVLSIVYPQLTINYGFDPLNRLTNMTDEVGTSAFSYTQIGQLANETGPWTSDALTNTYTQRLRTALSLAEPGGTWQQTYGFDSAWRMTNIVSPAGTFAYNYNFEPASAFVSGISLPNFAVITNSFDSLGRLTQTALQNYWGHTLDGYSYGYDPLGLRTNIVRNIGLTASSVAVGYDNIGQLKSWLARETNGIARLNEQLTFGFDAADNLRSRTNGALVQTFTVDSANELTNVGRSGTFTLSGAIPAPATNLTVNGQSALTYGDFTFASTNNTLANGSNSFAIAAQNVYGFASTNNLALNLPASVSLSFDRNGNLTNDGTRVFAYDPENQLTNISVAGQWKSDFVYDGLNRRRITRDFAWQSGAWVLTNEVHHIYDGYVIIQERDTNNNPLVTYTRGLDMSHSLQGAGGIGGLLARTDTNGSTFYHADGNGNINALMDTNQNIVARYLYNPFGKLLGQWGSMAAVNEMQLSSMPQHDGLTFFAFRDYEPNLQRFINQDPIGESGGVNLYEYVGNGPLNKVDPLGLQYDGAATVAADPTLLMDEEAAAAYNRALANAAKAAAAAAAGAAVGEGTKMLQPAKPTVCPTKARHRESPNPDKTGKRGDQKNRPDGKRDRDPQDTPSTPPPPTPKPSTPNADNSPYGGPPKDGNTARPGTK